MKVTALYTYPVKSFRPHPLRSAVVTKHGFLYDRRFMLLQVEKDGNGEATYKNMHVAHYPDMVLFCATLHPPSHTGGRDGNITLTFKPPKDALDRRETTLAVPLTPATQDLDLIDVVMHNSPTKAYKMPSRYNAWLSDCFGYEVILAYLGEHLRPVLMSTSAQRQRNSTSTNAWLSSVTSAASTLLRTLGQQESENAHITFADCAPYLVVSDKSMQDVQSRLPPGEEAFDIIKFRPSIVVSGAESVWEEDFWAQIVVGGKTTIDTDQNCGRCRSINIDYATGRPGEGEAGSMLKKMMSDRRVDKGAKWSPIFGRYSFLSPSSEGQTISVGDEVVVTKRNTERTAFDWKGLSTLPGLGKKTG